MNAQLTSSWLSYKHMKSEDELPPELAWSGVNECIPLKQRLKMLRANAASENRKEILIPISPADNVVNKEDVLRKSLELHPDQDMGKGRSGIASGEQRQHGLNSIQISEDFDEDLEHVSLKERRRLLLSRQPVKSIRSSMECNSPDPSIEASRPGSLRAYQHETTPSTKSQTSKNGYKEARPRSSSKTDVNENRFPSSLDPKPLANIKVELEPLDGDIGALNRSIENRIFVKSEVANKSENLEDIIDHTLLGDRMRLLASRKFPKATVYENYEAENEYKSKLFNPSNPFVIKRQRKRRRTATDSVETALEEDAPGLLQVLIAKGVLVDEIKLYGANEGDEPLDESLVDESFSDLEDVITKIFSQQQSLFKFAPIRCGKGEKTSYCLACLISLVEQARYLRVRNWPVEWGWCRDLQSFIFVFNKHNRIVLERPEYGYATYFFELVDALPVHWQIKRLVTAMKLSSCTRITLIENRALTVGSDVTEGEARVLMEYGWVPDTGLGTMLNYCDRVVHDRRNEGETDNSSEWKSKIGKLLTDGYTGGIIVPSDIPKKVMEYGQGHPPEIKLEY